MRTIPVHKIDALARSRLVMIGADAVLVDVAVLLSDPHIGLLVVCDADGVMLGVVTKTDVVQQFGRAVESIATVVAGEVMTRAVTFCRPSDSLLDVMAKMEKRGLAHIPVVDDARRPHGVVYSHDALRALIADEKYEASLLRDYVTGVGYQ